VKTSLAKDALLSYEVDEVPSTAEMEFGQSFLSKNRLSGLKRFAIKDNHSLVYLVFNRFSHDRIVNGFKINCSLVGKVVKDICSSIGLGT